VTATGSGGPRTRLVAAAIPLFAARGLRGTTWDDIAAAAGFARRSGTIFNYFPSKAALVEEAVRIHLEELEARPSREPVDDPEADVRAWATDVLQEVRLRQALRQVIERDQDVGEAIRALFIDRVIRPTHDEAVAMIRRHVAPGHEVDVDAVAVAAFGAIWAHVRTVSSLGHVPGDVSDERLVNAVVALVSGLLADRVTS
jgi:AcrR family transcriptional regulator